MKKYFTCAFVCILVSITTRAQQIQVSVNYITSDATVTKSVIYYDKATPLTWPDFKGKPEINSEAAAITNAGLGFKMMYHSRDNIATLEISVNCNFSPLDSWVKNGRRTPYILNHEQHHFDIAYLHTWWFIQHLRTTKYTMKDYASVIKKLYYQAQTDLLKMQNDYDSETKNSQLPDQQERWNKKIDKMLAELPTDLNLN